MSKCATRDYMIMALHDGIGISARMRSTKPSVQEPDAGLVKAAELCFAFLPDPAPKGMG